MHACSGETREEPKLSPVANSSGHTRERNEGLDREANCLAKHWSNAPIQSQFEEYKNVFIWGWGELEWGVSNAKEISVKSLVDH